jgi:hypothetical protein
VVVSDNQIPQACPERYLAERDFLHYLTAASRLRVVDCLFFLSILNSRSLGLFTSFRIVNTPFLYSRNKDHSSNNASLFDSRVCRTNPPFQSRSMEDPASSREFAGPNTRFEI